MPEWPRFDDKQRLNEEGEAFIKSQTTGALVTIGADGYPHATPLGFYRVGDDLYMSGRRRTQRVVNIERNPKVCFLVEAGSKMSDYRGLIIRGDAEVISDDAEKLRVARAGAEQRGLPEDQWPTEPPRGTLIRVMPKRYSSWDNTRAPEPG